MSPTYISSRHEQSAGEKSGSSGRQVGSRSGNEINGAEFHINFGAGIDALK
jgi:hypothetical protein